MTDVRLVHAERLEPKRVFRCVRCDPVHAARHIARRYRFALANDAGHVGEYCLPCAAALLELGQGALRKRADVSV